jgi:hypothetical protein
MRPVGAYRHTPLQEQGIMTASESKSALGCPFGQGLPCPYVPTI